MKKNIINEAEEEIKKVLLYMKYNTSKTLNENILIMEEEVSMGDMQKAVKLCVKNLDGIVEYSNLVAVNNQLVNLQGKTYLGKDAIQELQRLYAEDENTGLGFMVGFGYETLASEVKSVGTDTLPVVAKDIIDNILVMLGEKPKYNVDNSTQKCAAGEVWNADKNICEKIVDSEQDQSKQDQSKQTNTQNQTTNKETSKKSKDTTKYFSCPSPPFKFGCINSQIGDVQRCLGGLKDDNYLGPLTRDALGLHKIELPLTQENIDKVCKKTKEPEKEKIEKEKIEPESDSLANDNFYDQ